MNKLDASTEQLNEWAIAYRDLKDAKASHMLMRALKPLVYKHARRFAGYDEHMLEDMVQEGYIAILQASSNFDLGKSDNFFSLAATWVIRSIQNYSLKNWRMIRITDNKSVRRAYTQLGRILGESTRLPPERAQALADELGVDLEHVRIAYGLYVCKEVSANAPLTVEEGSFCLQDMIADHVSPEMLVEQVSDAGEQRRTIDLLMGTLATREKMIIQKRVMVEDDADVVRLNELGVELGVSTERVRQLEVQAIKKMRAAIQTAVAA